MILNKDSWLILNPEKKVEEVAKALTQLKEIDTPKSKLKTKLDQGRLVHVKSDLEQFLINAISWESEKQLHRHY
jgi:hypothetical protein